MIRKMQGYVGGAMNIVPVLHMNKVALNGQSTKGDEKRTRAPANTSHSKRIASSSPKLIGIQ
jgi:hypothetical protein